MLSVIIITKNEEEMITDCLESIKKIADEIIVVDSGNT
ncbi:MAG: glycosyltransferase, partial [Patescibacteria group bacterium]